MLKKHDKVELIDIGIAVMNMVVAFTTSQIQTNRIIKEIRKTRR